MIHPSRRLLLGAALGLGARPALTADPARDLVNRAIAWAGEPFFELTLASFAPRETL